MNTENKQPYVNFKWEFIYIFSFQVMVIITLFVMYNKINKLSSSIIELQSQIETINEPLTRQSELVKEIIRNRKQKDENLQKIENRTVDDIHLFNVVGKNIINSLSGVKRLEKKNDELDKRYKMLLFEKKIKYIDEINM